MASPAKGRKLHCRAVEGIFSQTEPETNPDTFDYATQGFGLIERSYPSDDSGDKGSQWARLIKYIRHLNEQAPAGTKYTLVYFGRHGEGYHNVAEAYYGTEAWDDYWSKLEGNGTMVWDDSHLTDIGRGQALRANEFFAKQFDQSMPAAQTYYVSPLYRCLQTANFTFSGLNLPVEQPFRPLIKELLREVMGEHTCDRRSTRTVIHQAFPEWPIEEGFAENDELWQAEHRETFAEHDVRSQLLLEDVFAHDQSTVISMTSHSGAIASFLRVLGHRKFGLPTGALIPALIESVAD